MGVDIAEIDDIIQEAYCRLSELAETSHIRSPPAYFFTTARSVLLQRIRHDRVVPLHTVADSSFLEAPDESSSAEQQVGAKIMLSRVFKAIAGLPNNYKDVVELRRIEGFRRKKLPSGLEFLKRLSRII